MTDDSSSSMTAATLLSWGRMTDRETPVWERLLRRDMEPPRSYSIVGDHPNDPNFFDIAFDDGMHVAVPKDHVWMLPKLAEIHRDVRRQAAELGVELRPE